MFRAIGPNVEACTGPVWGLVTVLIDSLVWGAQSSQKWTLGTVAQGLFLVAVLSASMGVVGQLLS